MNARRFAIIALLVAGAARADANITVDGIDTDWATVTTCFPEVFGDGTHKFDLVKACVTNNNSSGNGGQLFLLFENSVAWPANEISFGFWVDSNGNGVIDNGTAGRRCRTSCCS